MKKCFCFDTGCDNLDDALTSIALLSMPSDGSRFYDWHDFWNWLLAMIAAIERLPDDHKIKTEQLGQLRIGNQFEGWPATRCENWYSNFCDKLHPALEEFSD